MPSFGGSVKLTGESEYKKALASINQSLKEVDSELKLVTSQYDKNDKSEQALTAQTDVLNKKYEEQSKKAKTIREAYESLSKELKKQEDNHKSLKKELDDETNKLKEIEATSGKTSKAYQDQASKVSALSSQYEKEEASLVKNRKAVSDMYVEMNKAETAMNKTAREIDNLGKEADETTKSEKDLGRGASDASSDMDKSAKGGVSAFSVALGNLASSVIQKAISSLKDLGKEALSAFDAFDEGRDKVIRGTGATGEEAKKLIASYENVSKSIVADMGDIGQVVGDVNTRFGFTGDKLEEASTSFLKFSEVTGVDASTAVASISRAMEKAGMDSSQLSTFMDKLVTASQKTGVEVSRLTDSLTKYSAPMKELGFSTDETIALFSKFEASGVNVEQAFNGLQKSVANWSKEGKNSSEEFSKLMENIKNSKSDIEATQLAVEAFGSKTGVELSSAIRSGKFEYQDMVNTITSNKGALENTFSGTKDASDDVKLAFQNVKLELGKMVSNILVKYAPQIEKAVQNVQPAIEWIADNVLPKIGDALDWIGKNVIPVVADGIKWITDNINYLLPVLAGLGTALLIYKTWQAYTNLVKVAQVALNAVLNANPIMLVVSAIAVLTSALATLYFTNEDFREGVQETWNKIKEGAQIVWEWLSNLFTETIPQALYDLGEGIVTKGAEILEFIGSIPQKIGEFIGELLYNIDQFILDIGRKGANLVKDFGKWLGGIISDAGQFVLDLGKKGLDAIGDFVGNIISGIASLPGDILSKLNEILTNVSNFAKDFAQNALDAGKDFFTNLWNEVKGLPQKFINLGRDCIDGFWKGFKKLLTGDAMPISDLVDKCKKELGINSPSKVFADELGKYSALGFGVGFKKEMQKVSEDMREAMPSSFEITPEVGASSAGGIGGYAFNDLVSALKDALMGVEVVMDDRKMGQFVTRTVTNEIYST